MNPRKVILMEKLFALALFATTIFSLGPVFKAQSIWGIILTALMVWFTFRSYLVFNVLPAKNQLMVASLANIILAVVLLLFSIKFFQVGQFVPDAIILIFGYASIAVFLPSPDASKHFLSRFQTSKK
ncbi:MAG: hypothetical protein ABF737_06830 [Oenococcus sicerae]|nr:hypothetical protein OAL24_00647 [Oenococcus sicerae]